MSVFFIGDMHLGHRSISKYRPFVTSSQHNSSLISDEWRIRVKKRDVVYVMGDAAFSSDALELVKSLPGRKIIIKGNHDNLVSTSAQSQIFEEIHGMVKYKKCG